MPRERDTTPEEMLEAAEYLMPALGVDRMVEEMGGNVPAFMAASAAFGLIMQDLANGANTCMCDVCETLRTLGNSVTFPDE